MSKIIRSKLFFVFIIVSTLFIVLFFLSNHIFFLVLNQDKSNVTRINCIEDFSVPSDVDMVFQLNLNYVGGAAEELHMNGWAALDIPLSIEPGREVKIIFHSERQTHVIEVFPRDSAEFLWRNPDRIVNTFVGFEASFSTLLLQGEYTIYIYIDEGNGHVGLKNTGRVISKVGRSVYLMATESIPIIENYNISYDIIWDLGLNDSMFGYRNGILISGFAFFYGTPPFEEKRAFIRLTDKNNNSITYPLNLSQTAQFILDRWGSDFVNVGFRGEFYTANLDLSEIKINIFLFDGYEMWISHETGIQTRLNDGTYSRERLLTQS